MAFNLTDPIFHDEDAARAHLEALRWPNGPVCPYCGETEKVKALGGKSMGPGWHHCGACRKKFTVRVGTVYERSKVPLHKWLLATQMMASSKKGVSAHQLHRTLGVTYKTAWFMAHRIREAMREDLPEGGMGGSGPVEADETYFGSVENKRTTRTSGQKFIHSKQGRGPANKRCVIALVERGGTARTFHVPQATKEIVGAILFQNVRREAKLYTDESKLYHLPGKQYAEHSMVKHSVGEYARGPVHTNTVEGYFSIFKRGMKGIYQHCAEKHLHRYLAEYDFRYNHRTALGVNDEERRDAIVRGGEGKRLTYRRTATFHRPAGEGLGIC
ncbi:IS1595 family transposase [Marinicauda salina]|uniref:IS1595 family transposase n=1 Tax=Marinicauda salina TaxID=2135793 RepID=A0A2U2BSL6_9PROT|nr:IS1595 family transposase [Marinicauda salina]PWE17004.1 IS1595 family transposase [Marinicauda salina]